jgi:hypothetical protein
MSFFFEVGSGKPVAGSRKFLTVIALPAPGSRFPAS